MRCFKCLKEVPSGTEVCPYCGQILVPKTNKGSKQSDNLSSTQVRQKEYNIGDTIKDRYEVRALLGKKGTGFTYKVRDKDKKKIFILKQFHSFLITSEDNKKLFFDIVKKILSLNLSEVATIQEYGEDNGVVYIVTENIEGLTLRKLLDVRKEMKQFFKGEELESILTQICKVLIIAHNNGLLHGNLKPENIFILPNGIKITELGITTAFSPLDFTSIQQDLGDAYKYIAPEVVIGGALSKASDIYSLGVIVYEMLTGIIPAGIVNPPSKHNSALPKDVDNAVLRAIAQDPEQRTQFISEFYKSLLKSFGLKPVEFEEQPWITKQPVETEQSGTLQTEIDEELLMYIEKPSVSETEAGKQKTVPEEEKTQPASAPPIIEKPESETIIPPEPEHEKAISEEQPAQPVEESHKIPEPPVQTEAVVEPQKIKEELERKEVEGKEAITEELKEQKASISELSRQEATPPEKEITQPPEGLVEQKQPEQEINLTDLARHLESVTQEIQGTGARETKPPDKVVEQHVEPLPETQKVTEVRPTSQEIKAAAPSQPLQVQTPAPVKLEKEKKSILPIIVGIGAVAIGILAVVAWFLLKSSQKQVPAGIPVTTKPAESFTKPAQIATSHVSETVAEVKPPEEKPVVPKQEEVEKKVEKTKPEKKIAAVVPKTPPPKCPEGMVYIPAGYFIMGSSPSDPLRDFSEKPDVKVYVNAFCIDKYEYPNKEGYTPKVNVSFYTAERLCKDEGKRLCTEEEWEKACKGPSDFKYPYGNTWNASRCNTQNSDGTNRSIAPSGTYKRCVSEYGVDDMSGNVMEWTNSVFSSEDTTDKVVKGGSFTKPDWATRCAYRYNMLPNSTSNEVGFRCCRAPEK
ncbi:MAG: SUMF1/EgtB/PvdO family nonheme iron enzyme [bacterium]